MFFEDVRAIYSKLEDELSRKIYEARVLYNMTGDVKYAECLMRYSDPILRIKKKIEEIKIADDSYLVVIFGAGQRGRLVHRLLDSICWDFYIDSKQYGQSIDDLEIVALNDKRLTNRNAVFVVSPLEYSDEIVAAIKARENENDIIIVLNDECALSQHRQYFDSFVPHDANEIFVDAGVYDGGTTLDFCDWAEGEYKKIYMFEPSTDYYERFANNVAYIKNHEWIKKGLSDKEKIVRLFSRPDSDVAVNQNLSGIVDVYEYSSGKYIEIPVTSVDTYCKGEGENKVTFIKMDIEGSEFDALCGAEKTIIENHPKLAICLYHKLEDPIILPKKIIDLDSTYKLYIRHYALDILDTVLYAI